MTVRRLAVLVVAFGLALMAGCGADDDAAAPDDDTPPASPAVVSANDVEQQLLAAGISASFESGTLQDGTPRRVATLRDPEGIIDLIGDPMDLQQIQVAMFGRSDDERAASSRFVLGLVDRYLGTQARSWWADRVDDFWLGGKGEAAQAFEGRRLSASANPEMNMVITTIELRSRVDIRD